MPPRVVESPFVPRFESALPEGFPRPGIPGEVTVREYPAIRIAEATTGLPRARNLLFIRLFRHFHENGLAMTSPVILGLGHPEKDGPGIDSMAFIYRTPRIGRPGTYGPVRVRDLDPVTVASLGLRGEYDEERFRQGLTRLEAWLEARRDLHARAGRPRILAYDSPLVPPADRYAEVQIPVRRVGLPGRTGADQ